MNAAIYVRVSTAGQEDGTSLATQEDACRRYAAERGYAVADDHVYREVHSGAELWERPKLTALRQAVRAGEVAAVIAYAVDRLSREQAHLYILDDECDRAGVGLLFVTEEFDKTPVGKIIRSVKGFAAELEREKIRERTMRGMAAKLAAGKLPGNGKPPYGYRYRDASKSAYAVDPETAPTLRRIFALAAAGMSIRTIAGTLTAEGIPTPAGKPVWSHATIRCILHTTAYVGDVTARRWTTPRSKGKTINIRRAEAEIVALPAGIAPPLIDRATFDAVGDRLARNKAEAPRNNKDHEQFLLRAGFARCACCGRALAAVHGKKSTTTGYRYAEYKTNIVQAFHHPTGRFGISAAVLDRAVWSRVEALLTDPATVAAELEKRRGDDPTIADLAAVEQSLAALTKQQVNTAAAIAMLDDADAAAPLAAQLKALAERRRALVAEREAVVGRRASWQAARDQLAGIQSWCETVAANLGELTYEEKRLALRALDVRVNVWPAGHTPRYEITASIPLDGAIVDIGAAGVATPDRLASRESRSCGLPAFPSPPAGDTCRALPGSAATRASDSRARPR